MSHKFSPHRPHDVSIWSDKISGKSTTACEQQHTFCPYEIDEIYFESLLHTSNGNSTLWISYTSDTSDHYLVEKILFIRPSGRRKLLLSRTYSATCKWGYARHVISGYNWADVERVPPLPQYLLLYFTA